MKSNIKNILMFSLVAVALVAGYLYFFNDSNTEEAGIVPFNEPLNLSPDSAGSASASSASSNEFNQDLLGLLLSVKRISLDDSIFNDPAFAGLRDSSIVLAPVVDEGRPNPFAPIGVEPIPVFTEEDTIEDDTENDIEGSDIEELDLGLDEIDNLLDL